MNKRQLILSEAKRLFGRYGYLGFTLKQLAQACDMTSPALYYFYSSKAELFEDCLLSEISARQAVLERCMTYSNTIVEFAGALAHEAIEICDVASFTTGQAMREIIHLPEKMQEEIRGAWDSMMITPVEDFVKRILVESSSNIPYRLIATYFINMATFSAANNTEFTRDELANLFVTVAKALQPPESPSGK